MNKHQIRLSEEDWLWVQVVKVRSRGRFKTVGDVVGALIDNAKNNKEIGYDIERTGTKR